MTELILDDRGEKSNAPLSDNITTDIDALRQRYLPKRESLTIDSFQMAGIEIIETVRHLSIILGELTTRGWDVLRPHITWNGEKIETPTRWQEYCAMLWSCSRATVAKAWLAVESNIEIPQDCSITLFYEILSGTDSDKEAEEVLDRALAQGWTAWDVRTIKQLRKAGLLDTWHRPLLYRRGQTLYVSVDGTSAPFATLAKGQSRLQQLGAYLIESHANIKKHERLEAQGNDDGPASD